MRGVVTSLLLFLILGGSVKADSCLPGPPYPVVVIGYPLLPAPPTLPLPKLVPDPKLPKKTPPKTEKTPEPSRKVTPKPPLIPNEGESPEAKLPKEEKAFSVYITQRSEGARKEEGYRVKFFNHSERELNLDVEGQEVKIAPGEFVKLKLPREFAWKEKGGETNRQAIPPESPGVDIVIRR
jgi:hypothetical protein